MKKSICVVLTLVVLACCMSCYKVLYEDSLEEYIKIIEMNDGVGYSNLGIDRADNFLPSKTFLKDYHYEDGKFFWRAIGAVEFQDADKREPEVSFLLVQYEKSIYIQAKQYMLEKIKPYNNKLYDYNGYAFYENSNFIEINGEREFPKFFTMACYNDEKNVLIFIGFSGLSPEVEEKYLNDIEGNWTAFIDQYYGEFHDFSQ